MSNANAGPLVATYVFKSNTSEAIYIINASTLNLAPIKSIDNPNAQGYAITQGTLTSVIGGASVGYNIPATTNGMITNALWPNAADSQSGEGTILCAGIDRLLNLSSPTNADTTLFANDANSITLNFGNGKTDTATLLHSTFPPVPA